MRTFREIVEGIQKASDTVVDRVIKDEWNGKAITYDFDSSASFALSKIVKKVLTSKDGKYMYIPAELSKEELSKIKELKFD